jgi:hypothetical protein
LKSSPEDRKTSHVDGLAELYDENGYTSERNLKIQGNTHQNSNVIFCRNRKINPKIHMKDKKTLSRKSNPEQKEQC